MSNTCSNYTTTGSAPCGCVSNAQHFSGGCTQGTAEHTSCRCQNSAATENRGKNNCACRDAFATALRLLCSGDLTGVVDFGSFAFITSDYLIGSYRTCPCGQTGPYDNLADDLTGSFNRFTPCSCDLIDISGNVYDATPTAELSSVSALFTALSENLDGVSDVDDLIAALAAVADRVNPESANFRPDLAAAFTPLLGGCGCPEISVDEVSLCSLCAIAFEATGTGTVQNANYANLKQVLMQMLRPAAPTCPPCAPPQPQPCTIPAGCENTGLLGVLDRCGMIHSLSLTAGPLLLVDVQLLGSIGNVLILANDNDNRIYFVCSDCVEFVG